MAYKFQLGQATMSGNLVQEGDLSLKDGTSNNLTGSGYAYFAGALKAGDDSFQVSAGGAVTAASLNNSAGGITNAGAIAGATTIAGSGVASLGSVAVDTGATIGCDGDTDLLTLAVQTLTLASNAKLVATSISGSSLDIDASQANFAQGLAAFDNTGFEIDAQYAFAASGSISLAGASDVTVDLTADSVYLLDDSQSQLVKRDTWASVVSEMAGAGLNQNASTKKLEVSANTVTTLEAVAGADGSSLVEGYNVLTGGDLTGSITVLLPASPTAGDVVYLKNTGGAGFSITVGRNTGAHAIDGTSGSVVLESEYTAISFVYVDTNDWRLV